MVIVVALLKSMEFLIAAFTVMPKKYTLVFTNLPLSVVVMQRAVTVVISL
jgi:hypothetical protein